MVSISTLVSISAYLSVLTILVGCMALVVSGHAFLHWVVVHQFVDSNVSIMFLCPFYFYHDVACN